MSDEMLTAEVISVDEAVRIIEARRDSDTAFCSDPGCACAYHRALLSLSEKAQGYEVAVADNAALLAWVEEWGHAAWCVRRTDKRLPCADGCAAKAIASTPNPGSDLLAKHRAEGEALKADNAKWMRLVVEAESSWSASKDGFNDVRFHAAMMAIRHAIQTLEHPGAALLEQHRRALIRAKNEGLEMAARAAGPNRQLAERIRSMKEPEQ